MSRNSSDHKAAQILHRTQQTLIAAIHNAVETASSGAAAELASVGVNYRKPGRDHYSFVALHSLFLKHCGADPETSRGGDPKRAARMLHIGGKIRRYWEQENAGATPANRPESYSMPEEDEKDRAEWASIAENIALKTVLRALVEHAAASDPGIRDRMTAALDDLVAGLDQQSEQTRAIAEFAASSVASFIHPPRR